MVPPAHVLTGITPKMRMYHKEVFGPVAWAGNVPSLKESLREADGHPYGLGSNPWSEDEAERELFVRDVQSGPSLTAIRSATPTSPSAASNAAARRTVRPRHAGVHEAKTVWIARTPAPRCQAAAGRTGMRAGHRGRQPATHMEAPTPVRRRSNGAGRAD
ncbi:aldehyde dehydrogenase family protein [Streptomyces sp. NPDC101194]|uniref:aldehyde dehydrogenase family protein n=1 Tax=Streptomyces sp. NPDC101194 TaxID=3366127 RepID=UPI003815471A